MKLGIVCGLASERQTIAPTQAMVFVSGASAERAYDGACGLVRQGANALMSLGVSGALHPDLVPGDLLLPSEVFSPEMEIYQAEPLGAERFSDASRLPVMGSDTLINTAGAKTEIFKRSGAAAVDMESHAVARAARHHGVPFYVVRAVADPADQVLPEAASDAVASDGSIKVVRTLTALLRRPQDLPSVIRLGRQSARGHQTLKNEAPGLIESILQA